MTYRARLDVDAVFHFVTETTLSVATLSEHIALSPSSAVSFTASANTAAVSIAGATSVSTIVLKNTGKSPLRIASSVKSLQDRIEAISVRLAELAAVPDQPSGQPAELASLATKASVIRSDMELAHAITLPAGRVAVIPTTATITVAASSGTGTYSCLWLG